MSVNTGIYMYTLYTSTRLGPNDLFDPRQVMRHSRVYGWRILPGTTPAERRNAYLLVHTRVFAVWYLNRTAGIALYVTTFWKRINTDASEYNKGLYTRITLFVRSRFAHRSRTEGRLGGTAHNLSLYSISRMSTVQNKRLKKKKYSIFKKTYRLV